MKTWLISVLLALLAGYFAGRWQPASAYAQTVKSVAVPRAWGNFKGVYNDQLLFEDEHGTIRSVYPNGSLVVFTVTRR